MAFNDEHQINANVTSNANQSKEDRKREDLNEEKNENINDNEKQQNLNKNQKHQQDLQQFQTSVNNSDNQSINNHHHLLVQQQQQNAMDYDSTITSIASSSSKYNSNLYDRLNNRNKSSSDSSDDDESWYYTFIVGDVVKNFSLAYFVSVMGTGISSSLLYEFPFPGEWLKICSYISFAICYPLQASYMGCFSMGFTTIVNYITLLVNGKHMYLVWTLWWIAVITAIYTSFLIVFLSFFSKLNKVEQDVKLNATLLLPIVAITVVSSSGHSIEMELYKLNETIVTMIVSLMLWCISVSLAYIIMTIYIYRLIIHKIPSTNLIFTGFLPVGFLGQSSYSIYLFGNHVNQLIPEDLIYGKILLCIGGFTGIFLLSFGYFMTFIAIISIFSKISPFAKTPNLKHTNKYGSLKHNKGFWSMTFPMGTMSLGNTEIGRGGIGNYPLLTFKVMGAIFAVAFEKSLKPGPYRPYKSIQSKPTSQNLTKYDFIISLYITCISFIRLYKIYQPSSVVFDEIHIMDFLSLINQRKFVVDVHPPLIKLIYYGIAKIEGYQTQNFESIGSKYEENVPFISMRLFSGICGVLGVNFIYFIIRIDHGYLISIFTSLLILFENSLFIQSKFILLDSPLLLGQILTIFCFKKFLRSSIGSTGWWKFLILTGFALGWTISCKSTGIFILIWVGIFTIIELWDILGDLTISSYQWVKQVSYRIFGFLILPLTISLLVWKIYFELSIYEGPNNGSLSPYFRSSFQDYKPSPVEVLYGSTITIKHNELEKYLHSHSLTYPRGSNLQQVTLYQFDNDPNNEWIIETPHKYYEDKLMKRKKPVKDGDVIRLYHKSTEKYLHVNDIRPPISEHDYSKEVNCNETRGLLGDSEYEFKIRIMSKKPHSKNNLPMIKLRSTESIFQLIHKHEKCNLISHFNKLPNWAEYQNEVLCVENPTIPNSMWYIESNTHPLLVDNFVEFPHPISFWEKIWEIHKVMIRINSDFTNDHISSSSPINWPFVWNGIPYFINSSINLGFNENPSQIYFLGNVVIYIASFIIIILSLIKISFHIFKISNPYIIYFEPIKKIKYYNNSIQYVTGYFLNYLPYFWMERNLYAHHYLPALIFAILNMVEFINYQHSFIRYFLMISILGSSLYCFYQFIPIIYGTNWTFDQCISHKWFPSWSLDCNTYLG
ncbi:uncharacterized protein KGF55_005437 [Candida pseudojiufengensis]|uniref:uncharacterized protein n=1 Tax=Candida pseudojiufengensis TaxID=497109 RepID=UPI0022240CC2|nr:uncharacterized protein KGF55_005437 [Candida pseudojiufengensis]KAI5959287.1 hypothetical protein KGF55_005437 [Candida pseudojiufengensis]